MVRAVVGLSNRNYLFRLARLLSHISACLSISRGYKRVNFVLTDNKIGSNVNSKVKLFEKL